MPTSPATHLSPLDLALVAVYLVAITVFGLRFSRRAKGTGGKSLKNYFLADNTIPWWAIALSIVSAETSTLTIISVPGVAFAGDMGFLQIVLGYMVGRIVVALLFLPRYFRGEMLTAYQLIHRRFSHDGRFGHALYKLTAGLFLLTRAAAEGVRVFAISIVVGIAIGTGDILSIAIISGLTLLYTFEGGLAAVIWTDVVQMALYVAGTLVAVATLGTDVPGGWQHIHAVAAPLGKFNVFHFALNLTSTYTFWSGLLGGTFLTMASHGTDQLMVQRMLAARNLRESRLALLSSGAVIFLQFTLFLLIGVGLFVFYGGSVPHSSTVSSSMSGSISTLSPDRIFPTFIVHEMPRGVAGLLVAAILAAAMSNLSAALNSLASTTVVDFYLPWAGPARSARTLVSRTATVFWALVLFGIAVYSIQHGGKGHVVETGLSIASVAYGCLLGVFLLGTLTRYATQTGAILGMISGLALNLYLWQFTHIAFTWYVLIGATATFAVGSSFSLLRPSRRIVSALFLLVLAPASSLHGQLIARSSKLTALYQTPSPNTPDFTPISTLINAAIAEHKLPGAVVVIGHNGQVVFHHAYGNRALEPTVEPMTEDTIFDMASLTKVLVTTTAILQLYEQQKLDLDTPVAHYLPAFAGTLPCPHQQVLDPAKTHVILSEAKDPCISSSSALPQPPTLAYKSQITIRQLLTHYSGLPEDVDLKNPWGLAAPDKDEGIRRALAAVPYGPAGVTFKYSDINFVTLGALVETLSGEPLDVYAEQHIVTPLGMSRTRYLPLAKACGPQQLLGSALSLLVRESPGAPSIASSAMGGNVHGSMAEWPCHNGNWKASDLVPHTAPTAHDDQGTAQINPNFDHLLRGTVHDPTTRRMGGVAGHAGVFSTAADTALFAQALLSKLRDNTGPFPLSQATLRLATSPNEPPTAAHTATIFSPDGHTTTGVASRGLGWDLNSPFSRPRGELFPITTCTAPGSFGHTGFTGTSLWIDPVSNTYVILLANAIHPHVAANISALRGQVATAAARALPPPTTTPTTPSVAPSATSGNPPVLTGIDVLEATHSAALTSLAATLHHPLRLALLTNQSGLDRSGRRTIDILLHAAPNITLTTLFSPEHGLSTTEDTDHLAAEQDPTTHLPVISLYGPKPSDKRPTRAQLRNLDAVVIDLPDAGVRFWTYETLTGYMLEACAKSKIPLFILDRPNPIGGLAVQGPTSDPGLENYTDYMPLPVRHGLTLGELARYFNGNATLSAASNKSDPESLQLGSGAGTSATGSNIVAPATLPGLHASLSVVPMENYSRTQYFSGTGLTWTPPSPNLKTPAAAILYPALGLTEQTNVSVGRGTATPFENLGAPFLNAADLATYLTARNIPGIRITPTTLTVAESPEHYPFHGETVPAIHFAVTDREALDSPELGLELLAALHRLYPKEFKLELARNLLASAATLSALKAGTDPRDIAATWSHDLRLFRARREPYLLYH